MAEENLNIQFEDIEPWLNDHGDTGLTSRLKLKRNFERIRAWSQAVELLVAGLGGKYLSRTDDDSAEGLITFEKGLRSLLTAWFGDYRRRFPVAGDATDTGAAITADGAADLISLIVRDCVQGSLSVEEAVDASEIVFRSILRSPGGSPDMDGTGVHIDARTATVSTDALVVRGWMMVRKLIYNYLEIMEQDYAFSGGGDIEEVVDNGDGTYTCYMHKEKEGRHPAIAEDDILYGKVDDETGDGGYEYYTSWLRVHSVTLNEGMERDVMVVSLWDDSQVPGGRNFPPKDFMTVARRGNTTNPLRQSYWELSSTDHRLTHYWNVAQPILHAENYALALGILPSVLDDEGVLPQTRNKEMPSLYVNTIFYEHAHQIKWPAKVVREDRGQWTATPTESYHFRTYTQATWQQYRSDSSYASLTDAELHAKMMQEWKVDLEISRAWNNGVLWECLVDGTAQEPLFGCTDWTPVGGDTVYYTQILSSRGNAFHGGNVDTILMMNISFGLEDITTAMRQQALTVEWKRLSVYDFATQTYIQSAEDLSWMPAYADGNPMNIRLQRSDMGSGWMTDYRQAAFRCTVTFSGTEAPVTAEYWM